jgi:hypothetical protein
MSLPSHPIVSIRRWELIGVLLCAMFCVSAHAAESLRGVILSRHGGEGREASWMVDLAVGNRTYHLYYNEPLPKTFRNATCLDIGAIWSVVVHASDDSSRDIVRADCTGAVDTDGHEAWRLARDYIQLSRDPSAQTSKFLSERWRASQEFTVFLPRLRELDTSNYKRFGRSGTCIDIVGIKRGQQVQLRAGADCHLTLLGSPVGLFLNLVRNTHLARWEIDNIKIR